MLFDGDPKLLTDYANKVFRQLDGLISTNHRVKIYLDMHTEQYANISIFKSAGWQNRTRKLHVKTGRYIGNTNSAMSRAKGAVRDITRLNRFTHFITLTLDKTKVDRYDIDKIKVAVSDWLKNRVKRQGLQYVLLPERHKDGAIHYHGLAIISPSELINSGKKTDKGQAIYNWTPWANRFGYTAIIELDGEYTKVCNYILKYISKGNQKIFGKWYWSSRGLIKKPDIINLKPIDIDKINKDKLIEIDFKQQNCKFWQQDILHPKMTDEGDNKK